MTVINSLSPDIQADFNASACTLGEAVANFQRHFGLTPAATDYFELRHDAAHAVTGMTPFVADELRINLYLSALESHVLETSGPHWTALRITARESMEKLFWRLRNHHTDPDEFRMVMVPSATRGQSESNRLQALSTPLAADEIDEQLRLGVTMTQRFFAMTGKRYKDAACADLRALPFADLDLRTEAQGIKAAFQTVRNAEIEVACKRLVSPRELNV